MDDLQARVEQLEQEAERHRQEMLTMRRGLEKIHDSIQIFHALTLDLAIVVDKILEAYRREGGELAGESVAVPSHLLKLLQRAKDDWNRIIEQGQA
jgi:uncharacterized coiled-coil DUF342 family protein